MSDDVECLALHPEFDIQCEVTGPHEQHAAFKRGWSYWPNEDYVAPLSADTALNQAARIIYQERLAGHSVLGERYDALTEAQQAVLGLLEAAGRKGLTHDELIAVATLRGVDQTDSSIRTRCSELVDGGVVCESGERRSSDRGNPSRVWISRRI